MSGVPYEEYTKIFHYGASPVESSSLTRNSGLFVLVLLLIAFVSLSLTFLGDKKSQSSVTFVFNALVASISIGLSTIYVSNYVGVYI